MQLYSSFIREKKRKVKQEALTLETVLSAFSIDNVMLKKFIKAMNKQMDMGLIGGLKYASIAMLPSFVPDFYDKRDDNGVIKRYLALDLGGTNLRVLMLEIGTLDHNLNSESRNFRIPNAVMVGNADDLFGFIVGCIENFVDEKKLRFTPLSLGFTFSYPCDQRCLDSSFLIRWTKGFDVEGVEGEDVVRLLQEAIDRQNLNVKVVALMNDTVGTQIATAHDHNNCDIAVVIATGTNASYMEKFEKIRSLEDVSYPFDQMIIDTEWGGLGDRGEIDFVRTEYDKIIDENSVHPGVQSFDKMVGGMCMGELVRLVLVKLIENKFIFVDCQHGLLFKINAFPTKYISEILHDEGGKLNAIRQILEELGVDGFIYSDMILIREICLCVSHRSANLAAAAIACVTLRLNKKNVTVGIDGSTYRFHPFYHLWVKEKVKDLLPNDIEVTLVQAGDGSGKGAALVAAIADKLAKKDELSAQVTSNPNPGGDTLQPAF